jgi:hypothetical protein
VRRREPSWLGLRDAAIPLFTVIARSAATRQSMQWFSFPQRRGHPQGRLVAAGPKPLAMTMDLIRVFSEYYCPLGNLMQINLMQINF